MLRFLARWLMLSIPFGIAIGKFIKAGRGPRGPDRDQQQAAVGVVDMVKTEFTNSRNL